MQKSESVKELATALARAQNQIQGAAKDKTNPHFRSAYADLASVWDACREALTKNGLSVVQTCIPSDGQSVAVETTLLHSSGEYIGSCLVMPVPKFDPQGVGSAITYARRYALAAMVGVAPEDDDGEGAMDRSRKSETKADPEGKAKLEASKSLDELSAAWASLTPEQRHSCALVKDAMKEKLTKKAA